MKSLNYLAACAIVPLLLCLSPEILYAQTPPDDSSGPLATNLNSWSFFDTNTWVSDSGAPPISYTNIFGSPVGDGYSLTLDSSNSAWLNYNVQETNGDINFDTVEGSVVFWFAPDWTSANAGGTGPNDWGRFIEYGGYTSDSSLGWWSLYLDQGGTNIYFSSQDDSGFGDPAGTYLSAPITWTNSQWHMLALTYSFYSNCLYVDGALLTNGPGEIGFPGITSESNGFFIGSDNTGLIQARGKFDDLYTFNYQLDGRTIADAYTYFSGILAINPNNIGTIVLTNAPAYVSTSPLDYFTGPGFMQWLGTNGACIESSNVWMTNMSCIITTNGASYTFSVAGGTNGVPYDVFATTSLNPQGTNSQWVWMGQVYSCNKYTISGLPTRAVFFVLGTPQDSDGDGLTDAFERLVSHTDPYNPDADGNGLTDGWQIYNFGHLGIDPYADPDGDGWLNLEEFQNGTDPNVWNSPRAPVGSAYVDSTGANRVIEWSPGWGSLTGYTLVKYQYYPYYDFWDEISETTLSSTTLSFTDDDIETDEDTPDSDPVDGYWDAYQLYGNYIQGNSLPDTIFDGAPNLDAALIHGTTQMELVLSSTPVGASAIRVSLETNNTCGWGLGQNQTFDIPLSLFTNNLYAFSDSQYPFYTAYTVKAQAVTSNGAAGVQRIIESDCGKSIRYPFLDGSHVLKDNMAFTIQMQSPDYPTVGATYYWNLEGVGIGFSNSYIAGLPVYALASFHSSDGWSQSEVVGEPILDTEAKALHPWEINANDLNLAYPPPNVSNDTNTQISCFTFLGTGSFSEGGCAGGVCGPNAFGPDFFDTTDYVAGGNTNPCPSVLSNAFGGAYSDGDVLSPILMSGSAASVSTSVVNGFGLPLVGIYGGTFDDYVDGHFNYTYYAAGSACPTNIASYYESYPAPVFQPDIYQFTTGGNLASLSPTNPVAQPQTNLLIAGIGDPNFTVSAWLRYKLLNGNPNTYGYVEQYFDKAYQIDTNGNQTGTETGVLSPYGYFFPTQAGQVALVTKPNIDNGEYGTGIVNVVKLQLDVNHDGIMDLSFGGPDSTSQAHPFLFWLNNDSDYSSTPVYNTNLSSTFDPGHDQEAFNGGDSGFPYIVSMRDLEDYARMWICGVPALSAAQGYSATLSWNAVSGNPSIRIFNAADTNGGIGYLTDTNAAVAQIYRGDGFSVNGPAVSIGTVSTGSSYQFRQNFFDGKQKHLLFEGVGAGKGELIFTIYQGSDIVAQTGQWLDLHDIKDFYEQVVITNNQNNYISNWTSAVQAVLPAKFSLGDDTNLIVLVHGINVHPWDCLNDAETVLKRLYWAGYKGSFAEIKWPCDFLTPIPNPLTPAVFNLSEVQGYKASTAFSSYLSQLRERFPGFRLHLLVHSQGNSMVSEALARSGLPVDTYILTQSAVSDSAYDVNATTDVDLVAQEHTGNFTPDWQPWGYHGIYTNLTVRMVNFHNPQDGVVQIWVSDQELLKPSVFLDTSEYYYDGTNSHYKPGVGDGYIVTDPQESRGMVARSRSLATGLSGPESPTGVIQTAVDLNELFGFNDAIAEHSAQWTRPIQGCWGYYDQVLDACLIHTIQR